MTRGDVRNFVRHHSGQLSFVVRRQHQSLVDEEETTRKCESVNFVRIDDLDREWDLGVRMQNDILADAIYVLSDDGIIDELGFAFDLGR